jgi:hypothetical protein
MQCTAAEQVNTGARNSRNKQLRPGNDDGCRGKVLKELKRRILRLNERRASILIRCPEGKPTSADFRDGKSPGWFERKDEVCHDRVVCDDLGDLRRSREVRGGQGQNIQRKEDFSSNQRRRVENELPDNDPGQDDRQPSKNPTDSLPPNA